MAGPLLGRCSGPAPAWRFRPLGRPQGHSLGACIGAAGSLGGASASSDCVVTGGTRCAEAFAGCEGPYGDATVSYRLDRSPRDPPGDEASDPYANIGGNPDLVMRLVHGDAPDTQWYDVPLSASNSSRRPSKRLGMTSR